MVEAWEPVRDTDLPTIELELFREFERSELRRLETRRSDKRPRPATPDAPRR
jgi:hypothetical protein